MAVLLSYRTYKYLTALDSRILGNQKAHCSHCHEFHQHNLPMTSGLHRSSWHLLSLLTHLLNLRPRPGSICGQQRRLIACSVSSAMSSLHVSSSTCYSLLTACGWYVHVPTRTINLQRR